MLPSTKAAFYFVFTWYWGLCYGFVLMSSASGAGEFLQNEALPPGSAWVYDFRSSVLLNDKGETEKDVGFMVNAQLLVESVWGYPTYAQRLLKLQLLNPQLQIRSRKAPAPDGFASHTSQLDTLPQAPFLIEWTNGKIDKIHLVKDELISIANLKKGIASLFQIQPFLEETTEVDSSGRCHVKYNLEDKTTTKWFKKIKNDCTFPNLPHMKSPEVILGLTTDSFREADYILGDENLHVKSVHYIEAHTMSPSVNEKAGNSIEAQQLLMLNEYKRSSIVQGDSFKEVVETIGKQHDVLFTEESLQLEHDVLPNEDSSTTLSRLIKEYKDNLKVKSLGALASAKIVPRMVAVGRASSKSDIIKALDLKKSQTILHQLYDILGYVQTEASHEAVMKKLAFDDATKDDLMERYLWALSMSSHPNPDIIVDLINRYRKTSKIHDKVKETLLMTLGAMAYKLSKLPNFEHNLKVHRNVEEILLHGLKNSKENDRFSFLRALRNLRSSTIIPELLNIASTSKSKKEQVLAWKALASLEKSQVSQDLLNAAFMTFFQLRKKEDSSSRTLALDVILEQDVSDDVLKNLLHILLSDPKDYEIHQYLMQRLKMIAEDNPYFAYRFKSLLKSEPRLYNYNILAQKGLSTALGRNFLQHPSSNGTLTTLQEIQNGIVKRGIVNVAMSKDIAFQDIFSLGIFSGGLQSFVSSDADSSDSEDEPATAGIELSVLGTQIRPFVFFNGQSELMGHVWSGTASEKTPAYRALAMIQDHVEYLPLAAGYVAEFSLKGGASFDLSGNIETSLWNRNAVSLVEKRAGIVIVGLIRLDTSFVKSNVEFSLSVEPKLNLNTDLDFSSAVSLCMRLSQPDLIYRHNIFKIERVAGSKHKLRKVKYRKYLIPGKTYSLNHKNNEMCNVIFRK